MFYRLILMDFFLVTTSLLYYISIIGGVYKTNGSATQIGFIALAIMIPSLLISFFSGRFFKSYFLLNNIYICSYTKFSALIILYFFNKNLIILLSLIVFNGILDQVLRISKQSFDAIQIDAELRANFNSKKTFLGEIGFIIGPALGGILAAYLSLSEICFILAFISLIPPFFLINKKENQRKPFEKENQKSISFKENLNHLLSKKTILFLILSYCLVAIILEMQTPMTFPFVKEIFNGDNKMTGILFSISGIGGILGALIPIYIKIKNEAVTILMLVLFDGLFVFLFTLSKNFYISCTLFMFLGVMGAVTIVLVETKIQNDLEEKYRPFAFSIIQLAKGAFGASLATVSGIVADAIGAVKVLQGAAFLEMCAGTAILIYFFSKIKNINSNKENIVREE